MERFPKSDKLEHVCYDIRGPVHKEALRLEEEGHKILKLNIGNPAPFGFEAPDEILVDVLRNLPFLRKVIAIPKGFILPVKLSCNIINQKIFVTSPLMMFTSATVFLN